MVSGRKHRRDKLHIKPEQTEARFLKTKGPAVPWELHTALSSTITLGAAMMSLAVGGAGGQAPAEMVVKNPAAFHRHEKGSPCPDWASVSQPVGTLNCRSTFQRRVR